MASVRVLLLGGVDADVAALIAEECRAAEGPEESGLILLLPPSSKTHTTTLRIVGFLRQCVTRRRRTHTHTLISALSSDSYSLCSCVVMHTHNASVLLGMLLCRWRLMLVGMRTELSTTGFRGAGEKGSEGFSGRSTYLQILFIEVCLPLNAVCGCHIIMYFMNRVQLITMIRTHT